MFKKFFIFIILSVLVFNCLNFETVKANGSWNYYRVITIDSSLIDADIEYFTLMVKLDNSIISNFQPDGEDIRFFVDGNSTELYYEIDQWDGNTNIVWVNVTRVNSTDDRKIIMRYGNSLAGNNSNPFKTWDSHKCIAVWHFKEQPSNTVGDYSASNGSGTFHNATPFNLEGGDLSNMIIGDGITFDGSDEYYNISDHNDFSNGAMTWYFWVNSSLPVYDQTNFLMSREWQEAGYQKEYSINVDTKNEYIEWTMDKTGISYTGRICSDPTVVSEIAHNRTQFVLIWGGGLDQTEFKIYHNSTQVDDDSIGVAGGEQPNYGMPTSLMTDLYIPKDTYNYAGSLDEVRYYNKELNQSHLKSLYHSEKDNLITISNEVAPPLSDPIPEMTNFFPLNNSAFSCPCCITLGVTVSDTSSYINITFYSNYTGSWGNIGSILNVIPNIYRKAFFNFTNYETDYFWNISVNDGNNTNDSTWFKFTTDNYSNCNITGGLTLEQADNLFLSGAFSFEVTTLGVILMLFLLAVGYEKNDYLFVVFSGFLSLALGLNYILTVDHILEVQFWIGLIFILLSLYCMGLSIVLWSKDANKKKK